MTNENELPTPNTVVAKPGQWFEDNLPLMPLTVIRRHQFEFTQALENFTLRTDERMEMKRALNAINKYLDSVLPKVPASLNDHDRLMANRAHRNWPERMPKSTLLVHLHLCELVDSWRINPMRRDKSSKIYINSIAESDGRTKFEFDRADDRDAFVKHYQIEDFVVQRGNFTEGGCFLILSNKFTQDQANEFMTIYNGCINRLSAIADARTRAIAMDNGRVGFLTIDHFITQESMEMAQIREARKRLGAGTFFESKEDEKEEEL